MFVRVKQWLSGQRIIRSVIKIWDIQAGQLVHNLNGHTNRVNDIKLLKNGNLASGSDDDNIIIWDTTLFSVVRTLTGHGNDVVSLIVLDNGYLVSASFDNKIKIWNAILGTLLNTLTAHGSSVNTLSLLNNGLFASGSDDKTIIIWDASFTPIRTISTNTKCMKIYAMSNGNLASGEFNRGAINVWNTATGALEYTLTGHADTPRSFVQVTNSTFLSASDDGTIRLWNLATKNNILTLTNYSTIYSLLKLNSGYIASSSNATIRLSYF